MPFSRLRHDSQPTGGLVRREERAIGANALACRVKRSEPQCGHTGLSLRLTSSSLCWRHFSQRYSKSGMVCLRTIDYTAWYGGRDPIKTVGIKTRRVEGAPIGLRALHRARGDCYNQRRDFTKDHNSGLGTIGHK